MPDLDYRSPATLARSAGLDPEAIVDIVNSVWADRGTISPRTFQERIGDAIDAADRHTDVGPGLTRDARTAFWLWAQRPINVGWRSWVDPSLTVVKLTDVIPRPGQAASRRSVDEFGDSVAEGYQRFEAHDEGHRFFDVPDAVPLLDTHRTGTDLGVVDRYDEPSNAFYGTLNSAGLLALMTGHTGASMGGTGYGRRDLDGITTDYLNWSLAELSLCRVSGLWDATACLAKIPATAVTLRQQRERADAGRQRAANRSKVEQMRAADPSRFVWQYDSPTGPVLCRPGGTLTVR